MNLRQSRRLRPLTACLTLAAALVGLAGAPGAQAAVPGINVAGNDPSRVAQALATNAKLVRFFVEWKSLQPTRSDVYPSQDPGAANLARTFDDAIRQVNAAGAKPIFVILGTPEWANGTADQLVPPTDPQDYADFFARFVRHTRSVGDVAAYEVWNEQDGPEFWHAAGAEDGDRYGTMLRATYKTAKPVAGDSAILVGPLTGNNATYLSKLYASGSKGSFDGVAVHTDTACLALPPDFYYREDPGARIGRFTFVGYRSVRAVMAANDDLKPIWMTELGWTSTGGQPSTCARIPNSGTRSDGVTEADQAAFLKQAYGCLARDPYVVAGFWFTMFDNPRESPNELRHYGLVRADGSRKPSYAAFTDVTGANGGGPGPCGDFDPPTVRFLGPADGVGFTKSLLIQATATDTADTGVRPSGLARISLSVDGKPAFFRFTSIKDGETATLDWLRAADLTDGEHTLSAEAADVLGNTSKASIKIRKGAQFASKTTFKPKFVLPTGKNPKCLGRRCSFKGRLTAPPGVSIAGRVRVEWQFFSRQRVRSTIPGRKRYILKWVTFHKGGASAKKSFTFTQRLAKGGKWRVRVFYAGALPLLKATTSFKPFSVR